MERLASDVSEVAAPILRHATMAGASGREQSAARAGMPPGLVETPPAPERLTPACIDDSAASDGADASELAELFHAATSPERRLILANLDYSSLPPATLPPPAPAPVMMSARPSPLMSPAAMLTPPVKIGE